MEQIPNHLFELIGQKPFEALSPEERAAILQYMDEGEYRALHGAALISRTMSVNTAAPNAGNKAILMQRFREKQQRNVLYTPIALWKVAATLLLFGLAFYFISMRPSVKASDELVTVDTVYIEKEMPVKTIFDTVYITENKTLMAEKHTGPLMNKQHSNETPIAVELPADNSVLNRLSIEEYRQLQKNKKRRNIKDDSLIRSIGFVHL